MSERNDTPLSNEIVFESLEPTEIPVKLGDQRYILREASADATVKYRNVAIKAARMTDGKVTGMDGIADAEPLLVSLCLCVTDAEGRAKLDRNGNVLTVPLNTVRAWPNRVQKRLYDEIVRISPGLVEAETEEVLLKRRDETQSKLDAIKSKANGDDPSKNLPLVGTDS